MACDKPIVASNVGGMLDIIKTEKNGFLAEVGDVSKFAEYIMKYINDKDLCNRVVNYNYEYSIKKFNISELVKEHKKLFEIL